MYEQNACTVQCVYCAQQHIAHKQSSWIGLAGKMIGLVFENYTAMSPNPFEMHWNKNINRKGATEFNMYIAAKKSVQRIGKQNKHTEKGKTEIIKVLINNRGRTWYFE